MNRRGFSLIEVLIALAVLAVGGLGTLQLIDVLSKSTGNMSAEDEAMSLARQLRQEMEMQRFLPADVGVGVWSVGTHTTGGGEILTVGTVGAAGYTNNYNVQYLVAQWNPDIDGDGTNDGVRGLDITIVVDNQRFARTAATERRQRLLHPVTLSFRKEMQNSVAVVTGGTGLLRW